MSVTQAVTELVATDAGPASRAQATTALTTNEIRLALRRGENLLATIVLPAAVLVFFGSVAVIPTGSARPVDFILPGTLALAVVATSLVSLGITTGYERSYGVLKRLGGSPATTSTLVTAKTIAVLVIEVVQVVLLVGIAAVLLGWRPPSVLPAVIVAALVLGTATFAGLGLLFAGRLRAEANLALVNGLFLVALLLGGVVVPIDKLPGPMADLARVLPVSALGEAFRIGLGSSSADPTGPLVVLAVWAVVAVSAAVTTFRWE